MSENNIQKKINSFESIVHLPILKRTAETLEGQHPSIYKGLGQDFADLRAYQPGDDIHHIDWKSTAKGGVPVIKRYEALTNAQVALILDSGKEMIAKAKSGESKIEVANVVSQALASFSVKRGDAIGFVAGDESRIMHERTRYSNNQIKSVLTKFLKISSDDAPQSDFYRPLSYASRYFTKRSFFVLILDEIGIRRNDDQTFALLRRVSKQHSVMVFTIQNANPYSPEIKNVRGRVVDVTNKSFVPAYFRDQKLADQLDFELKQHRKFVRRLMKRLGIIYFNISGTDDFFNKFAKSMQRGINAS